MANTFTINFIEKQPFPQGNKPVWFWDKKLPGLGLKITKTKKVFIAQGRVNSTSRRITIGPYPRIDLPTARDLARDALVNMAKGLDPSKEKKRNEAFIITVGEVYRRYLVEKNLKPSTVDQHNCRWRTVLSVWEKKLIADITRKDVEKLFDSIKSKSKANLTLSQFRAYHNWAAEKFRDPETDERQLRENPVSILSNNGRFHKIKPRTGRIEVEIIDPETGKTIQEDEIGVAYNALMEWRKPGKERFTFRTACDVALFAMFTGCRKDEARSLRWENVNLENRHWKIINPKNKNLIILPLPTTMAENLKERPQVSPFVFPARNKHGHVWHLDKVMVKVSDALGHKVIPHDLRRTFKSLCTHLRIEKYISDILCNHESQDVAMTHYNNRPDRREFFPEIERIGKYIVKKGKIQASGLRVIQGDIAVNQNF